MIGGTHVSHPIVVVLIYIVGKLGDFGLGIGLYFSTLRAIAIITLLAGLINIPNIIYFSSSEYLPSANKPDDLPVGVLGSAICFNQSWVPCPNCACNNDDIWEKNRCANTLEDGNLTFVLRNNCDGATKEQGIVSYATMLMVLLCCLFLAEYLRRQEVKFDEDEQTAQVGTILVSRLISCLCLETDDTYVNVIVSLYATHMTIIDHFVFLGL
jgi:hypothetical protein